MRFNAELTRLVMSDEVLQAKVRLAGAEVGRQEREKRRYALVDALIGLLRLQLSQGALCLLAEQRALPRHVTASRTQVHKSEKQRDEQITYPRYDRSCDTIQSNLSS